MENKTTEWMSGPVPTVCRCCLAEGCYKDISTEYFWMGKREVYAEMLSETFDLSIAYAQSGGPNSHSRLICEPCISRLRDASEFKKQVQECEKTFMNHLDPCSTTVTVEIEPSDKVKLETVKEEQKQSDSEDFEDRLGFEDDDDDDLDDQPLTKLASKPLKKEKADLLDLLDNSQITVKRKSTLKAKAPPAKKAKLKIKEKAKPSPSKAPTKTPKKKKENKCNFARRNAEILVRYTTAYPFKLPEEMMVCVYCGDAYPEPEEYRRHMKEDHSTFNFKMAFVHCKTGDIKVDITDLRCRLCSDSFDSLEEAAHHLHLDHDAKMNLEYDFGLQYFVLRNNSFVCAICNMKNFSLRNLSRHTQTHFVRYTCEACGKSYSTNTALQVHIKFSHNKDGAKAVCRKCKLTFQTAQESKEHLINTPKCWQHVCNICGKRHLSWNLKQAHMKEEHNVQKIYTCQECGKEFQNKKGYNTHFKMSHTDNNFVCPYCHMKCDSKRRLEDHKVVHTKERLFPCAVCPKSFPRKKNLIQHMWMHSESKRFECEPCEKKFNQKISWKMHMKSHHPEVNTLDVAPKKVTMSFLKQSDETPINYN